MGSSMEQRAPDPGCNGSGSIVSGTRPRVLYRGSIIERGTRPMM